MVVPTFSKKTVNTPRPPEPALDELTAYTQQGTDAVRQELEGLFLSFGEALQGRSTGSQSGSSSKSEDASTLWMPPTETTRAFQQQWSRFDQSCDHLTHALQSARSALAATLLDEDKPAEAYMTLTDQAHVPVFVLQCCECRRVVGDSTAWVMADTGLDAITLQAPSPYVRVDEEALQTSSTDGPDKGSTYAPLYCDCGKILGRSYRATPRALDPIRDMFTFLVDTVDYYELGSSAEHPSSLTSPPPTVSKVMQDTYRLKCMILVMMERIEALEGKSL
ncbi:yippee zinc-binding/DNA-binding /Mis18, centromere assembly-domain-containing protein [Piptocephalis cylindrospora]|uniref:Yippee zinc-binding/DNA-binding /Mis18, centromere assembly-domain-containing protein n=1 Tax=Piptocephalis cylindrospora TaxID=1907219 RepID=A0A4P9Y7E6_9FUNG|nr:yippee zinc-binding/DNA-binding /Mis18, centromere assembly-domain-containing protein [Piptocephalis cylindrospora]|eukprot:RKP13820.1 yippee zinc-binding/DNA-binding /Mis18, centromere assembly-domain-containing protein [Piptocephalis cylindrospora]